MILMQTKALFIDAYRQLNAQKLFWITMVLSVIVVLILAGFGIDEEGVSFLWFDLSFFPINSKMVPKDIFYLQMFSSLGIGIWLTWIATILALISTSGIIPDLISGGTIETTLSKPISRSRLFLTKYFTGLLFVALQVGVFTAASFLVIGLRGKLWEPGLFLAIPIVVTFFSYLFSVSVLVGMISRAAMPAVLLTCLFWALLFGLNLTDLALTAIKVDIEMQHEQRIERIEEIENNTARLIQSEMNREEPGSGDNYTPELSEITSRNPFLPQMRKDLEKNEKNIKSLTLWTRVVLGIKTVLPKTGETASLLERYLINPEKFQIGEQSAKDEDDPAKIRVDQNESERRVNEIYRSRPLWWVLGTSLIFEILIVLFCTWRFTRRDF